MQYEEKLKEVIANLRTLGYTDHQIKEMLSNLFMNGNSNVQTEEEQVEKAM